MLKDVNIKVNEGEIVTIVGANVQEIYVDVDFGRGSKAKSGLITYKGKPHPNTAHNAAANGIILVPNDEDYMQT